MKSTASFRQAHAWCYFTRNAK